MPVARAGRTPRIVWSAGLLFAGLTLLAAHATPPASRIAPVLDLLLAHQSVPRPANLYAYWQHPNDFWTFDQVYVNSLERFLQGEFFEGTPGPGQVQLVYPPASIPATVTDWTILLRHAEYPSGSAPATGRPADLTRYWTNPTGFWWFGNVYVNSLNDFLLNGNIYEGRQNPGQAELVYIPQDIPDTVTNWPLLLRYSEYPAGNAP